jgi:chemotaxis protein MotB
MVVLMEQVAKALVTRPGGIVVRGHTDGRPFRGGSSDNWRLSTSRAHMTHYMLVRGGIPERRVERIEGYADQKLRLAGDAEAAQNRRIEILLRVGS